MTVIDDLFEEEEDTSLYDITNKNPHKSLYVAVILQALLDMSKPKLDKERSNIQVQRNQAHSWVFASVGVTCKDFQEVCLYAGLKPESVREAAYNLINLKDSKDVRNTIKSFL
tara:strand:- start:217 stop:555 length:339 start_codon:yes stop_codon:yes gene_type:complete